MEKTFKDIDYSTAPKVLEVKNLRVNFKCDSGLVYAVRGVSFDLYKGETLCIVGESGSGKSVTSKTIMGILASNAIIESGQIMYEGEDLVRISEEEFQQTVMRVSGTSVLSLDDVWYSGDDSDHVSIGDSIESPASYNPDVIVEREEIRRVIIESIKELPEKEKMVLVLYYHEDLTFKEIGQVLNVSESRISQLHSKANLRLRAKLTNIRKGIM